MTTQHIDRNDVWVDQPRVSTIVLVLRALYLLLAVVFLGAVVLQFFFAGATLLTDPRYLIEHRALGAAIAPLPLLMIATGLFGRLSRRLVLVSVLLLALYALQFILVFAVPALGLPSTFRALHAVNALVLFGVALNAAKASWRVLRSNPPAASSQP